MRRSATVWLTALLGALLSCATAQANPSRRSTARRARASAARVAARRWHDPARAPAPRLLPDGRMVLRLSSINGLGAVEVTPLRADGGFDDAARGALARVLGDPRSNRQTAMDPRLLDVIYQLARHFRAGQVNVISGYRSASGRSNHARGRAADIALPGVGDEALARYAREMGFLGVGVYPHSGFVHVDVRTRSFFWVEGGSRRRSRGRRRRGGIREVHGDVARRADEAARARGVQPLGESQHGADDEDASP
ncbi:MAG: DUF882 domain-containing protein [Polyangiales bacterium]